MHTIIKSKVFHFLLLTFCHVVLFLVVNSMLYNQQKVSIVNEFKSTVEFIEDSSIDKDLLYVKYDIIKLVYIDKNLISSPTTYPIDFYFDTSAYNSDKVNNYLGYFVFETILYEGQEIIYIQRLPNSYLNNNFFYLSGFFMIATMIINIIIYCYVSKKFNFRKKYVNGIFTDDLSINDCIEEIEKSYIFSKLFSEFITHCDEGLIIFKNKNMIFNNDTTKYFVEDNQLIDTTLINFIEKAYDDFFVKEEYEIDNVVYLITTRKIEVKNSYYYLMHISNITERINFKKNQITFFNHASHELRTPLTNLSLLVQLLFEDDNTPEEVEKMREDSINECRKLDVLISSIIDLSKKFEVEDSYVKVDLQKLINDALATHKYSDILLNMEIDKKHYLICNKNDMKIIMENVIKNAYTHNILNGTVDIKLKEHVGLIEFVVTNTSESIKNEEVSRVFEPFFKCNTSNINKGSGLGLALVKQIVDKYNYDIKFEYIDKKATIIVKFFKSELNKHLS